jgi:hypothetical protein
MRADDKTDGNLVNEHIDSGNTRFNHVRSQDIRRYYDILETGE